MLVVCILIVIITDLSRDTQRLLGSALCSDCWEFTLSAFECVLVIYAYNWLTVFFYHLNSTMGVTNDYHNATSSC